MTERKTATAKRTYVCASPNCVWGNRIIQRGESHAVVVGQFTSLHLHHPCADQDYPELEEDETDEYENIAESWKEHCDMVNYINGR